jgi:tetratricopeptide (TPR) repeat protein
VATEYGFPLHRAQALIGRAAAWAMKGNPQEALAAVDAAYRDYDATGARLQRVWFMALVAEIYLRADRLDDAESALADAQTSADKNLAFWWLPELWRLRGIVAMHRDSSNRVEAEQYYRRAHEVALEQNGRMPALRAATCWATLLRDRGDDEAANRLLAGALAEIHEGEELPDLKEAKALMADLV